MLEVVVLSNGRFAVQNSWTGIILSNRRGKPLTYRTVNGAIRLINRRNRRFNKSLARITKSTGK